MPNNALNMTKSSPQQPLVVVLAYQGLCTFEFSVATEVFGLPRPEMGENWYRFAVAALDKGPLSATGGIRIMVDGGLELLAQADTIIIPGWRGTDTPVPPALLNALRQAASRGCRLVSICSGVFVLAATGLLNGAQATTHWRYAAQLKARYPAIRVNEHVLYIDEGQCLTSAGSAAGIDLCLHLVRKDYGPQAANLVAQRLVVPPHRDGGQAQFIPAPVAKEYESSRLGDLFDYLHQHLHCSHSVEALANRCGMSSRTLLRRFADATGTTPARWLLQQRLQKARQLLEESDKPVEYIAQAVGFGTASVMRRYFQQYLNVSPRHYRKTFTVHDKQVHKA
ncbi:transcriptional regulator [Mangrovibacter sp. MFB070]|uniref:transcriptional regulator FtrA n=1 Tax=Mangrovibacter sp. MFB070 TaxID=1224318 RepID=UPI0004D9E601|nr:transcriptional regulator FtrA [Mangrovibacter sp. MFB070]KEA51132.1 transcriptional regulator [Mangrovibacter sp. MFB070]